MQALCGPCGAFKSRWPGEETPRPTGRTSGAPRAAQDVDVTAPIDRAQLAECAQAGTEPPTQAQQAAHHPDGGCCAAYDAARVSGDAAVADGVTPSARHRNFLLTPAGDRPLGARSSKPREPLRIPYDALERSAPTEAPPAPTVRQVEYGGGAVALICEPK
jgi:hypothetical protein